MGNKGRNGKTVREGDGRRLSRECGPKWLPHPEPGQLPAAVLNALEEFPIIKEYQKSRISNPSYEAKTIYDLSQTYETIVKMVINHFIIMALTKYTI